MKNEMMKVIKGRCMLFLWGILIFSLSAGQAQTPDNVKAQISLPEAFEQVKKNWKCDIVYKQELIREAKPVILEIQGQKLEEVMRDLLKQSGLKVTFNIMDNIVVLKKAVATPPTGKFYEIKGKVTDVNGLPIPGVSVRIEGSSLGTVSDADGNYKLFVHTENSRLVFSFVGMKPETVTFVGQKEINVVLYELSESLDEVVVTGYQVIDKRELTSSIETIKADDLDKVGALTVDQMLEGKAAGLMVTNLSSTPGAAAKIRVRSGGTFTGSRAPLWVVDGIIYEDPVPLSADDINSFDRVNLIGNALTGLNPQDIESINILKDASATAIYGTRAANGVIVVTTKRGKEGTASISYSGSVSVVNRPHYSDFDLMDSKERVDVSREIAEKNLGYPRDILTWTGYEKVLRDYRMGTIDFAEFQRQVGVVETMNTDWFGELYRPAITSAHNLSISGGSKTMRYYFSVGYNYNQGTEYGVGLNRVTARSNVDLNLRKNFLISLGMSGSVQEAKYNHSSVNLFDKAYYSSRTTPFSNPDGSLFFVENKLNEDGGKIIRGRYNVRHEMNNSEKNVDNKDFTIDAQMSWDIVKGIKLRGVVSYRNTTNLQEEWINQNTYFIANLRTYDNMGDKIDDLVKRQGSVPFGGIYSGGMTQQRALRGQMQVNFSKVIAEKHVFNLNLGYEANSIKYKGSSGWSVPGYDHDQGRGFIRLPRFDTDPQNGDLINFAYVNALKWMAEGGSNNVYPTITDRLSNSLSFFAIFNYSFDNRYVVNFNMRGDGSNSFGQYERYKFKPTWSVSGRWNIHNESFVESDGALNELALRASYGFRGNPPSVTPYMVISNYKSDPNWYDGEFKATMQSFPNANLTWERTSTLNLGINHSWLKDRLSGSFDFAYSHGKDLLLSRPVSLVNGQSTQQYNGGEKKDYSYELSLRGIIFKTKKWGWNLSGNMTMTKEKVLAGYEAERTSLKATNYLNGSIYLTGFPVDAFYSYQFDGLDEKGAPKFKNLEDKQESIFNYFRNVLTYSGRRSPKVYGGFNTEVRYKNLTLRAGFSYKVGHHVRRLALFNTQTNVPMPDENMSSEFNQRWRQPGDEAWAVIPGLSNELLSIGTTSTRYYQVPYSEIAPTTGSTGYDLYNMSDLRVVKGDHIRWQSLSLNYRVPDKMLKKIGFNSMNLNFSANNLAVWAFDKDLKGQDPEQVSGVGMPALPTYSLSINFGF